MALTPVAVIDGRSGRKLNNALTISFFEGTASTPFATAVQGARDSFGLKLGILFGFRNGSVGNHELRYTDGTVLSVPTRNEGPTDVSRGDVVVARITRGPASVASLPDGTELLRFVPHPDGAQVNEAYRMLVLDPSGAQVAALDVIRESAGWGLDVDDLLDFVTGDYGGEVGGSLPIPFRGTRLVVYREVTDTERDVLLAACVEIALGVRPYIAEMGERGAAWT
ncbi:hypothetical protein BH10ACT7_BH10ACT7_00320 [soil metagenome]